MSTTTEHKSCKTLGNLVQIVHDGQQGFKKAAEDLTDPTLKDLFSRFSLQRAKFAGELETELNALGDKDAFDKGSTVTGAAHRVWIDLKSAVTGKDNHAVLAEAERGEDAAVKAYRDALAEEDLPATLRDIISRQAAEVQATHDEVKALRDSSK